MSSSKRMFSNFRSRCTTPICNRRDQWGWSDRFWMQTLDMEGESSTVCINPGCSAQCVCLKGFFYYPPHSAKASWSMQGHVWNTSEVFSEFHQKQERPNDSLHERYKTASFVSLMTLSLKCSDKANRLRLRQSWCTVCAEFKTLALLNYSRPGKSTAR